MDSKIYNNYRYIKLTLKVTKMKNKKNKWIDSTKKKNDLDDWSV